MSLRNENPSIYFHPSGNSAWVEMWINGQHFREEVSFRRNDDPTDRMRAISKAFDRLAEMACHTDVESCEEDGHDWPERTYEDFRANLDERPICRRCGSDNYEPRNLP